jgi:hypothetical protein
MSPFEANSSLNVIDRSLAMAASASSVTVRVDGLQEDARSTAASRNDVALVKQTVRKLHAVTATSSIRIRHPLMRNDDCLEEDSAARRMQRDQRLSTFHTLCKIFAMPVDVG